ncbi:MAG: M3 family metallopeptidase [Candidatus Thorarchaeota archaeon]
MVNGASAPEVKKKLDTLVERAEHLYNDAGNRVDSMSPSELAEFLEKAETLSIEMRDMFTYCGLRYSTNTQDKEAAQLNSWNLDTNSKIDANSAVLDVKLGNHLLNNPELLEEKELENYKHYLERIKAHAPYLLSEVEEKIIIAKDVNGIGMLDQLKEAWVSAKIFEIEIDGKMETVPRSKLSSMRTSPDRRIREMASKTLYKSFADDAILYGTALNGLCRDHVAMTNIRGMPSTMTKSLLDHDMDEEVIEALLSAIEGTAKTYQDFLKLKAKYMGTGNKLLGHDIIAPWITEPIWSFDWPEAREIIIDSFTSFDDEMGKDVQTMFEGQRIDSINRVGKIGGAFCAGWPSQKKSFVMMSYNNTMNNLFTLAHELGHAAQGTLIFTANTPFNHFPGMCMAETGSIFGELLLTDILLQKSKTDEERFEILSHVLNGFFYTVYYVGTRAFMEKSLYKAVDDGKLIDGDLACNLWNASKDRIFGDAVDWSDYMEYEWARIPHFFFANYRFVNYPYSFAQMLVFAVYEAYQKGEADFAERFKRLLSRGGSMNPRDQIAEFGYDLSDPSFWELGPRQADRLLSEFKKLI